MVSVKTYDPSSSGKLKAFYRTPSRIPKGSKVELYETDGKVLFYTLVKEEGVVGKVPDDVKAEIDALERRKVTLGKTAKSDREALAVNQALMNELRGMDLAKLREGRKAEEAELKALKAQLKTLKKERTAEAKELIKLQNDIRRISEMRRVISVEVAGSRPVKDVPGVTAPINAHLRELGIRTVGELTKTQPEKIRKTRVLTLAKLGN